LKYLLEILTNKLKRKMLLNCQTSERCPTADMGFASGGLK